MAAPAPAAPLAPATPAAPDPDAPPHEPKLLKQHIDHGFHFTLTCDLEMDLSAPKIKRTEVPLKGVALAGVWSCKVVKEEEDGKERISLHVLHGVLPIGLLGQRVRVSLSLSAVVGDKEYVLNQSSWDRHGAPEVSNTSPPNSYSGFRMVLSDDVIAALEGRSGGHYKVADHRLYRLVFELEQARSSPTSEARELAERIRGNAQELARVQRRPLKKSSPDKDCEDSDEETDRIYFEEPLARLHEHDCDCPLEYKQVTITKSAYTTYRAVLTYLRTGFIPFAPLSSACKPLSSTSTRTRKQRLLEVWYWQDRPLPVSPKSVFRLAHLLELEELQELCLANLRRQLTVEIAPVELVDDASVCFDEWRKVIIDYIFENWDNVEGSEAWKKMQGRIRRDEVPGAAPVMLELMARFATRKDKGAPGASPPPRASLLTK